LFSDRSSTGKAETLKSRHYINIYFKMKKQKITRLSLGKNTISSLKASHLSGGTGSYDCWTFAPPCASFTEPPETDANCETTYCTAPPGGTTGPIPTNQTCGASCNTTCNPGITQTPDCHTS